MPAGPRCSSLASQMAPVGASVPYAGERPLRFQNRRSNCKRLFVTRPYLNRSNTFACSVGKSGVISMARSVVTGTARMT